ncbi:MAG: histidine kinase dimerization/phospho-acceptor domain-containing protein [Pirellulales bacterium]
MSAVGFWVVVGYDETARALAEWDQVGQVSIEHPRMLLDARLAPWLPLFCVALVMTFILIWIGTALELRRVWEREQEALREARAVNQELRQTQAELASYSESLRQKNAVLCESQRRAEEAVRTKNQFLANMSHELRTPLTAILGFAELLKIHHDAKGAPFDETFEPTRAINTVLRNGEHLLELIDDLLDYAKIEVGKMSVERISVHTTQVVGEVLSLLRLRAKEKNLELSVVYQDPIPEKIKTDPLRLRQILVNLVGNALKFTERGGVKIVVRYPDPTAQRSEDFVRRRRHRHRYGRTDVGQTLQTLQPSRRFDHPQIRRDRAGVGDQ